MGGGGGGGGGMESSSSLKDMVLVFGFIVYFYWCRCWRFGCCFTECNAMRFGA